MCDIDAFLYCFSILNINARTQHTDLKGTAAAKCLCMRLKPLLAILGNIVEALLLLLPEFLAIVMPFVRH